MKRVSSEEIPPFIFEIVMVQAVGFHCAAYCDEDGNWRDAISNDSLFGVVAILG